MGVDEHQLASWGRRLAALLVDIVVLGLAIAIALYAAGMKADDLRQRVEDGETLLVVIRTPPGDGGLASSIRSEEGPAERVGT